MLRRLVKVDAVRANLVNGLDLRINPLAGPEVAFSPVDHGDQRKLRVVRRHLVLAKRVEQSPVQILEPAATGFREGTARLVEDQVVRCLVDLEIPQRALLQSRQQFVGRERLKRFIGGHEHVGNAKLAIGQDERRRAFMLSVKSGDYRLSLLISHLEPRRLWRSLGEPGGRRGSKLDQDRILRAAVQQRPAERGKER